MTLHEQHLTRQLRENGYKLTQARRAVIQALLAASTPLAVNDLHEQAQAYDAGLGLVTVYRTLEILTGLGLARPVHLAENCHGYSLATPGHTHHLVCRLCSAVVEFEGCDLSGLLEAVAAQTGYAISGHWLELEGLCPDCQRAGE